ncbi:MAG: ribosome-binding factor A [Gammaproteobacteria bacterium]|nr:MAG: ribosome-binding factor A [Gammaproteobacteria bacterium]
MAKDYPRSHRVADFIQRELAVIIRDEVDDPDVSPLLTIVSVEVSRDLSVARVYYSFFGDGDRAANQKALTRAAGFLRHELAGRMSTRTVPELRFFYDDSAEKGAAMSALIDAAVASNSTANNDATDNDATDNTR